ncbi:MAG: HU family DNA-binding protein [Elusimicrobia bacterium]|nr:HU family DNA-binding protein [Elusimicrobiota bacterium]
MKKEDIVNKLSLSLLDKKQAAQAFEKVFEIIKEGLERDGKVIISNFGVFTKVRTKPVTRHNPKTLEKVDVPSKIKVRFKSSPAILQK